MKRLLKTIFVEIHIDEMEGRGNGFYAKDWNSTHHIAYLKVLLIGCVVLKYYQHISDLVERISAEGQ